MRGYNQRRFNLLDCRARLGVADQPGQHRQSLVAATLHHVPTRRVRNQEQQRPEQYRRYRFRYQHEAPARGLDPDVITLRCDSPVDEIHQQHAEHDRQLIEGHQPAANLTGRDFGNVEWRQHRSDADTDAAQDSVENEGGAAPSGPFRRWDPSRIQDRPSPPPRSRSSAPATSMPPLRPIALDTQPATMRADDAAEKRARYRPAGQAAAGGFGQMLRINEIGVDRADRAGDDGGVVTEQQTAQRGDERQSRD